MAVVTLPSQPNIAERLALENLHEEENEPADGDPANADQGGAAKPQLRKDSQVEEKNGNLGNGQDGEVERFINVEEQESVAESMWVNFPDVDAERELSSWRDGTLTR